MQSSVFEFVKTTVKPSYVRGKDVVEAGAMNVNGSVRPLIELMSPGTYLATDKAPGPGVDVVCAAENLSPLSADLVISTDMLEHASDWHAAMLGMVLACRYGGWIVVTAPGPGFPFHCPPDNWRFTEETLRQALVALGLEIVRLKADYLPETPEIFAVARRVREPVLSDLVAAKAIHTLDDTTNEANSWFHRRCL